MLDLGVRDDAEARDLRRAAALYEAGRRGEARRLFARHDSLEAKLGAAFAAWPGSLDRVEQLGALYPRSALAQLHLGLARFWAGEAGAIEAWREAREVEPDTLYAVRANDLLHPEFAPGLPVFVAGRDRRAASRASRPRGSSRLLRAAADSGGLDAHAALRDRAATARPAGLGAAGLRRGGPRASGRGGGARRRRPSVATRRSGPRGPSRASGRSRGAFPSAATVRFHLGVLLLWQRDVAEAKRQLRLAAAAEPGSRLAREAERYLEALR